MYCHLQHLQPLMLLCTLQTCIKTMNFTHRGRTLHAAQCPSVACVIPSTVWAGTVQLMQPHHTTARTSAYQQLHTPCNERGRLGYRFGEGAGERWVSSCPGSPAASKFKMKCCWCSPGVAKSGVLHSIDESEWFRWYGHLCERQGALCMWHASGLLNATLTKVASPGSLSETSLEQGAESCSAHEFAAGGAGGGHAGGHAGLATWPHLRSLLCC